MRAGVAAAGLVAFVFVASAEYKHALSTLLNPTQDYNYDAPTGRLEIWKRGVGYMVQRPISGVGAGAFAIAEGSLSEIGQRLADQGEGFKWSTAHNAYVQVGAETGFPGIYFFLAMLGSAFMAARRVGRFAPHRSKEAVMGQVMGASMLGYAVSAFFLSAGYSAMLYSLLGLVVGFTHHCEKSGVVIVQPSSRRTTRSRGAVPVRRQPAANPAR